MAYSTYTTTTALTIETMVLDPEYGGWGYLAHELRTEATDRLLADAANQLELEYTDVFLWANSTYGRHFMDTNPTTVEQFVTALDEHIPLLRERAQL